MSWLSCWVFSTLLLQDLVSSLQPCLVRLVGSVMGRGEVFCFSCKMKWQSQALTLVVWFVFLGSCLLHRDTCRLCEQVVA